VVYVPVLFLIAIVVVGQHHTTARDTLRAAVARTGRWLLWSLVLVVTMLVLRAAVHRLVAGGGACRRQRSPGRRATMLRPLQAEQRAQERCAVQAALTLQQVGGAGAEAKAGQIACSSGAAR
jgi:hypothetical protein